MTRVKEADFCEGKITDLEETKRYTGLESADGTLRWARGILCEDADPTALVLGRGRVADEIKEGEEDPDSTKILMIRL